MKVKVMLIQTGALRTISTNLEKRLGKLKERPTRAQHDIRRWFFTRVWTTSSLFGAPGLFSLFSSITTMLRSKWSKLTLWFLISSAFFQLLSPFFFVVFFCFLDFVVLLFTQELTLLLLAAVFSFSLLFLCVFHNF